MAIGAKEATVPKQYAQSGSFPGYAVKLVTCNNDVSGGTYTLNPFSEDMVILEAYLSVTTVDGSSGTLDVGLDDDIVGDSSDTSVFNEQLLSSTGIYEGLPANAVVSGTVRPIWKAPGSALNSFIIVEAGSTAGDAAAVFHVLLVIAREADFE